MKSIKKVISVFTLVGGVFYFGFFVRLLYEGGFSSDENIWLEIGLLVFTFITLILSGIVLFERNSELEEIDKENLLLTKKIEQKQLKKKLEEE